MDEIEETRIKDAYMVVVEMVDPTSVLYVTFCPTRFVVVVVEAKMVEAVREDPVRVEKEVRERPGTLIVEALRVETVREPVKVDE